MSLPRTYLAATCAVLVLCPAPRGEPPGPRDGRSLPKDAVARTDRYGDSLPQGARERFGTVRLRHAGQIRAVCLSPDGRTLASAALAGQSLEVALWDTRSGRQTRLFPRQGPALAFSPDGRILALGGEGGIGLWDVVRGREVRLGRPGPLSPKRLP